MSKSITVETYVKEQRLKLGLSQGALARRIGVHKQLVSNFEREKCRLPIKHFHAVSRVLGVETQKLVKLKIKNVQDEILEFFA